MPDGYFMANPLLLHHARSMVDNLFYTICYANGKCENVTEDTIRHHAPQAVRKYRLRN